MNHSEDKNEELNLKLETRELAPLQIRLIKNIHALMSSILTSEDESEFFESSSELFKKSAELVKSSNYCQKNKKMNFGEQAVEFSIDNLFEDLQSETKNYDN